MLLLLVDICIPPLKLRLAGCSEIIVKLMFFYWIERKYVSPNTFLGIFLVNWHLKKVFLSTYFLGCRLTLYDLGERISSV